MEDSIQIQPASRRVSSDHRKSSVLPQESRKASVNSKIPQLANNQKTNVPRPLIQSGNTKSLDSSTEVSAFNSCVI